MSKSFIWAIDATPAWFSAHTSYRMNPDTHQLQVHTEYKGIEIVDPGDTIILKNDGSLVVKKPHDTTPPNRQQRRDNQKHGERLVVSAITVTFDNGHSVDLDTSKVMIIDKDTKAQLFNTVIQEK